MKLQAYRSTRQQMQVVLAASIVALSLPFWAGSNRWTTNGPYGGAVHALAVDPQHPDTVYAGTGDPGHSSLCNPGGGIYKSTDAGASWSPSNSGVTGVSCKFLVIDPNKPKILYTVAQETVTSSFEGFFKTTDAGKTWSRLDDRVCPSTMVIDPQVSTTLYTASMGVSKSTDGGKTWSDMSAGLPCTGTPCLAIDPKVPSTLYVATGGLGLYKSTDGAASWHLLNMGVAEPWIWCLAVDPVNSMNVYAGISNATGVGAIYKSTDAGATWNAVGNELPRTSASCIVVDPVHPQTVYAALLDIWRGTANGVYKSLDGGATWSPVNAGMHDMRVSALAIDPANASVLYAGTYEGVYKTTDGGASWAVKTAGMTNVWVNDFAFDAIDPGTWYAGSYSGLFRTKDGGNTWTNLNTVLPHLGIHSLTADPWTGGTLYAITYNCITGYFDGFYKTTDGGESWRLNDMGMELNRGSVPRMYYWRIVVNPQDPQILYLSTADVKKSEDGGENWTVVGTILTTSCSDFAIDPHFPDTLYASTSHGMHKSVDGGVTWTPQNVGLTDYMHVYCMAMDPLNSSTLYIGSWMNDQGMGGVFKTTDGAATWIPVANSNGEIYSITVDRADSNVVYLGLLWGGVYRGSEGGTNWYQMRRGLTNLFVKPVTVSALTPDTIYCATSRGETNGVWTFTKVDVTPPVIRKVSTQSKPFRLKVEGSNFHGSAEVMINGWPAPKSSAKGSNTVIAKGGKELEAMVPRGYTVMITVENANDGGVSEGYFFTRH